MSEKTATIIGATGMIGHYLLQLLLQDPYFSTVRILVRRPYTATLPKLEVKLVDFADAESYKLALEDSDVIFCCIGTTQQKVKGNKELYRQIDYDIPLRAARFGKEAGCKKFIIVTAIGANSRSSNFYLRLKGEVEDGLQSAGMRSVHVMQPSMLLGERAESRLLEKIIQAPMQLISPLFFGGMKKFRAIHGKTVAAAMVAAAKKEEAGFFRYRYEGIKDLENSKIKI